MSTSKKKYTDPQPVTSHLQLYLTFFQKPLHGVKKKETHQWRKSEMSLSSSRLQRRHMVISTPSTPPTQPPNPKYRTNPYTSDDCTRPSCIHSQTPGTRGAEAERKRNLLLCGCSNQNIWVIFLRVSAEFGCWSTSSTAPLCDIQNILRSLGANVSGFLNRTAEFPNPRCVCVCVPHSPTWHRWTTSVTKSGTAVCVCVCENLHRKHFLLFW